MRQKTMSVFLVGTKPLLKVKVKLLEQVNEMSPKQPEYLITMEKGSDFPFKDVSGVLEMLLSSYL